MLNTYKKLLQDTTAFMQESAAGSFIFGLSSETSLSSKPQLPVEKEWIIAPPKEVKFEKIAKPIVESKPIELPPAPKPQSKEAPKSPPLEIQRTLQKIAPRLHLIDSIPDDALAQRLASAWKERIEGIDVVVLALEQSEEEMLFIKNLAKAIHSEFLPTRIITGGRLEQEKRWDLFLEKNAFRLIVASNGIQNYPNLLQHYRDQGQTFLGTTPLIALSPAAVYNQSKEEKATLWKKVCQILKNPPPVLPPSS